MKRNLLKVIGISFIIFVILSWVIPVGTYSEGTLTTDGTKPIGLYELFSTPISTLLTFALYAVVFAAIGGFYSVVEKTGVLDKTLAKASANKGKGFLIFSIIFFTVLSSVTGLTMLLFVLVPLFAMIMFAKNYDKITVLAATVGGILLGSVGSTYGFNITGYTKNLLSVSMNNEILGRIILLIVSTAALIFFALLHCKKVERKALAPKDSTAKKEKKIKEEKVEEPKPAKKEESAKKAPTKNAKPQTKKASSKKTLAKKSASAKPAAKKGNAKKTTKNFAIAKDVKKVEVTKSVSMIPFLIIFILMLLIAFVGMYNWYYSFGVEVFNNMFEKVMAVQIGDYPILKSIFGGFTQFGYWGNTELAILLVIASALIAFVYRLGFNEYIESFIAGVKKILPTALYATLASIVLYVLYSASYYGTGTIVNTINGKILGSDFNVFLTSAAALIGSFFYNDLYYLLQGFTGFISSYSAGDLKIAALLIQAIYGLGMMIFPTSVVLIAGLSYFDVKWGEWLKYIWKVALTVLVVILAIALILVLI